MAYRDDRHQLATWYRVTATVDSATVTRIEPSGLNRGRWVPVLYMTVTHRGQTFHGAIHEPLWARRTRARAVADAAEAERAGTAQILIDPLDDLHISLRPDDAVYYYRDAWQRAGVGAVLLLVGFVMRSNSRRAED